MNRPKKSKEGLLNKRLVKFKSQAAPNFKMTFSLLRKKEKKQMIMTRKWLKSSSKTM